MATGSEPIGFSIVIPVFNEEAVLPVLLRRLDQLLARFQEPAEAIFVDDGSSNSSPLVLQDLAGRDPRFRYVGLSRNFGHQIAITAGMDAAQGNAIVVMDADLQDPPEIVDQLIAKWKEGYDVVHARRLSPAKAKVRSSAPRPICFIGCSAAYPRSASGPMSATTA